MARPRNKKKKQQNLAHPIIKTAQTTTRNITRSPFLSFSKTKQKKLKRLKNKKRPVIFSLNSIDQLILERNP